MSQSASQAAAFYKEVAQKKRVWTVRDDEGYPAPLTRDGQRAQPFWSSLARVQKIIKTVPAYSTFRADEISWEDFTKKWVPGLTKDNMLVGVNWSGSRATGYDIEPKNVQKSVEALFDPEHPWWRKLIKK